MPARSGTASGPAIGEAERKPLPARPASPAAGADAGRPKPGSGRRLRRRIGLALAVLAAAAGGLAAAWLVFFRPVEVTVAELHRDVPVEVYGLGSVEARVRSSIGFEVSGTVYALRADEGDRVAGGAVLAELDRRQQDARLAQAEAGVAQAEATLEEAEAALNRAEVVLAQARRTSTRRQELARTRVVSEQAAEEAVTAVETAVAERAQAASRIRVARANLEQAAATLTREQTLLDQHILTAPFAALVVARRREAGDPVRAADPVFDLIDADTVWVRVFVDEALSGRLRVRQPAVLRLRSLPGVEFHGEVARIGIENDRIGEERRVEIVCRDCPDDFHLGEQAEAIVTTSRLPQALLVPHTAFEEADARSGVLWTLENGRLRRHRIAFGHRTLDGRIEIPAGALPAGALAVAERRPGLREGREAVAKPPRGAP
jgi:HlyD family secretion protein